MSNDGQSWLGQRWNSVLKVNKQQQFNYAIAPDQAIVCFKKKMGIGIRSHRSSNDLQNGKKGEWELGSEASHNFEKLKLIEIELINFSWLLTLSCFAQQLH